MKNVENSVHKFLKKKFENVMYIKKKLYFCIVKTNGIITKKRTTMKTQTEKIKDALEETKRLQKVLENILKETCYMSETYAETLLKDVRGELYIQLELAEKDELNRQFLGE